MVFWLIVVAVVGTALLLAWRADRRRKVTITRRNADVESDVAGAWFEVHSNRIRRDGFGGPSA
jgi:hypothetical protein